MNHFDKLFARGEMEGILFFVILIIAVARVLRRENRIAGVGAVISLEDVLQEKHMRSKSI